MLEDVGDAAGAQGAVADEVGFSQELHGLQKSSRS